jgi:hypothetical protein
MTDAHVYCKPLETSVLFLVFNRPSTTKQVFEAIRRARPPRLYVAADGPRDGIDGDRAQLEEVRKIVTAVDWPCEVKTLFRDYNLGCKIAVSSAISWFFDNEDQGIILEDDCLPSQSFFWFCESLLDKYHADKRISMITGGNYSSGTHVEDYLFSQYSIIWGWATWRDRWIGSYDVNMGDWPSYKKSKEMDTLIKSKRILKYWITIFERTYLGLINTWDYQWHYTNLRRRRLSIVPKINLISNIGVSIDATHEVNKTEVHERKLHDFNSMHLKHPCKIEVNKSYDKTIDKLFFTKTLRERNLKRLKKLLNCLRLGN